MTHHQIAVNVTGLSKSFALPVEKNQSLRTTFVNYFKGVKGYKKQQVLEDVSFDVEVGDFFGIVGRNGSGKSTLLKLISQIYLPDEGSVKINGKLVSFIELGVGFHPDLTGKENVYLNGALLGFTSLEMDEMYDEIVEFAELHDFMHQKLKNYSSGMQVRLAFAVAVKAKGDILVLDEVLAVGDEAFQRKCNDYFLERKSQGKTTILVTHDMAAVKRYCNRAILIENGQIKAEGNPVDIANQYSIDNAVGEGAPSETTSASSVQGLRVNLLSKQKIEPGEEIEFEVEFEVKEDIETYLVFSLTDLDRRVWIYNDNTWGRPFVGKGRKKLRYRCTLAGLNDVKLQLQVTILDKERGLLAFAGSQNSPRIFLQRTDLDVSDESAVDSATGLIQRNGEWEWIEGERKHVK